MKENENIVKHIELSFRKKLDDENYEHNSLLNRVLDRFGLKLIKAVGLVGIILGLLILIALWIWIIRWLYQVW